MASELRLEVEKYYRTRDGRKVGPMKPEGREFHCAHGDADLNKMLWNEDGSLWIGDGKSPLSLIAEWSDAPTGPVRTDADATPMLTADNKSLRDAGNALAIAAINVATEYDGVHRLMLAVAEWAKAVANEGGRGDQA